MKLRLGNTYGKGLVLPLEAAYSCPGVLGEWSICVDIRQPHGDRLMTWSRAHVGRHVGVFLDGELISHQVIRNLLPARGFRITDRASPMTEEEMIGLLNELVEGGNGAR